MTDRLSAYGHIKRAEVKGALSPDEQEELEGLEANTSRTMAQANRIHELWAKAFREHVPPQVDPLFDLAAEVAEQMRARLVEGEPLVTKTGRVLTDADIEALADEAEQGYDP